MINEDQMTFYHYTSTLHLERIEQSGLILPTESNVGSGMPHLLPYGTHCGPDVVWLLDTPDPFEFDHGLTGSVVDKRAVRIEVHVPAIPWLEWYHTSRMNRFWREGLIEHGGGPEAAMHWYVWPAPIRRAWWGPVTYLHTTLERIEE